MPSTATITSFFTFSANTKARATQVNANFDIFRGHILPVDPNTQTSINNTYELGSFEYVWKSAHLGTLEFGTSSAASASLIRASDTSASELVVKLNGTEKTRVNTNGVNALGFSPITHLGGDIGTSAKHFNNGYINDLKLGATSSSWRIKDDTTTVGDLVFLKNNTEIGRVSVQGFNSSYSDLTIGAHLNSLTFQTTTPSPIATMTVSMPTNGRAVEVGFICANTIASSYINAITGEFNIFICRDTSAIIVAAGVIQHDTFGPPSGIFGIDQIGATTTVSYVVYAYSTLSGYAVLNNMRLYAKLI